MFPFGNHKKIAVLPSVFEILHELIFKQAETYKPKDGHSSFSREDNEYVIYGYGMGKTIASSIFMQMLEKLDLNNLVKWELNDNFSGKKLYNLNRDFKNGKHLIRIDTRYLDIYCSFIGFENFEIFIKETKDLDEEIKSKQLELNKSKIKRDPVAKDKPSFEVPSFLWGIYDGYFLRPTANSSSDQISKLSLIITDEIDKAVVVRTTESEKLGTKVYNGTYECKNTAMLTLTLEVITKSELFNFTFIFHLAGRDTEVLFDGYLKGIYSGEDPITRQPVAGRLILVKKKSWDEVKKNSSAYGYATKYFNESLEFRPYDLSDEQAIIELNKEAEKPKKRKHLLEFFTTETRYVENIKIIEKYAFNNPSFSNLAGSYSIFSLHSSEVFINNSIAIIKKTGEVIINGSRNIEGTIQKYQGLATLMGENRLSLITKRPDNSEHVAFYMIRVDASGVNKKNCFNGVRIMRAHNSESKPFAGRVVFFKESDDYFTGDRELEKIPLFPENEIDMKVYKEFENSERGYLIKFLRPENNLVKTFGVKRQKNNFNRDIDYGETFFQMAKFYRDKNILDEVKINLHYAVRHGRNDAKELIEEFGDYLKIQNNTCQDNKIKIYSVGEQLFYSVEIE